MNNSMRLFGGLTLSILVGVPALGQSEIRLEGAGARRDTLNAMQLRPFDTARWDELSSWANVPEDKPVNAETASGKVVVFVTWSSWYRASFQAAREAQSLHTQYADQGLVVVAVHNPRGFEGAADSAKELGISFPYAADADGKFREAMKVDQDPDFFIVDRSGNLRFADVETPSVETAVKQLLAESVEQAAAVPGDVAAAKTAAAIEAARTGDVKNVVAPGEYPKVEFELPDPELYKPLRWPSMVKYESFNEWNTMIDKIVKDSPTINMPDEGWTPAVPDTKGKLIILYVYDPGWRDMLNVLEKMNRVQDVYLRDAVVVSNAITFNNQNASQDEAAKARAQERSAKAVAAIQQKRVLNHPMLAGVPLTNVFGDPPTVPIIGSSIDEIAVVLIASTDGIVRWAGHPGDDSFHVAVKKMRDLDPGVKARRAAEDLKARRR